MHIPKKYTFTSRIVDLLQQMERSKTKLELLPSNPTAEKIFRQKSVLKSSVFSARVEGNPTEMDSTSLDMVATRKDKTKIELDNLRIALEYILDKSWSGAITINEIQKIHKQVLMDLSSNAGSFRREQTAVFNLSGVAIYVCPSPKQIEKLMTELLNFVNSESENIVPIKASLAHYSFEKVHPFLDGNGRVGRLLVRIILRKYGYDLRGLVAFEEYIDKHKQEYYDFLAVGKSDITEYVEFFLEGIVESIETAISEVSVNTDFSLEALLPPRRQEILQIIREHKRVTLDFIQRRFMAVSGRLLRYDLKKLNKIGLIRKRGVTKGVVYEVEDAA